MMIIIKNIYRRFIKSIALKHAFFMWCFLLLYSCGSSHPTSIGKSSGMLRADTDTISSKQQRKFDYFYLEALRLKGNREYDAAFDLLQHCLLINPNSSAALYEIGQYYLTLKQLPQGIAAFKKATLYDPNNYWYNQALVNLYQQQNDSDNALKALEVMSDRFPEKQDPLLNLLDLYNQKSNYPKVIQTLDRLEKLLGKNEQISMEKFRVYLQMNNSKEAFHEIESLSQEYPTDSRYRVILGDVYLQNGKKKQAYDIYQKVLASEPDNAMALYSLANYYDATGQKALYKSQLDTLLLNKKVPSDTKVEVMRQMVSQYQQENRDSTEVIKLFDKVIDENPDDAQVPMLYANYLIAKGMDNASLPVLEHIVQLDPTNVASRLMLLSSAVKKEDYKKVIQICEPGIEATPESLELYFYLAIAYNQAQRYDDALVTSRKALTHVKTDSKKELVSDFYALIGDLLHSKAQIKEAYAAYDSSLVYNPDNIGTLNNYAYYLSEKHQQLDQAEEMSYKTVKAEPNNSTYLDTYAWILFIKGKYMQARIYIDNAMKNGGGDSDVVTEHCGDIYAMNGNMETALKYWIKAQSMGNKSELLKKKIVQKKYLSE